MAEVVPLLNATRNRHLNTQVKVNILLDLVVATQNMVSTSLVILTHQEIARHLVTAK